MHKLEGKLKLTSLDHNMFPCHKIQMIQALIQYGQHNMTMKFPRLSLLKLLDKMTKPISKTGTENGREKEIGTEIETDVVLNMGWEMKILKPMILSMR